MASPAPTPLLKQYVICLNSNMLGMLYEPAGFLGSPDNTMRDNPNEPTLHPLIRNWFGSQSPDGPHVNIDPYRRAMSLDYGYTYPLTGEGEYLINTYQYENADTHDTNTPYTYKEGNAVGPDYGSLGIGSYSNFDLGGAAFDTLDLRFNERGWNGSLPSSVDYNYGGTPGSVVSPYYASLLDEENKDEWNEGVPYFKRYLMGSTTGWAPIFGGPLMPGPTDARMSSAGLVGTYDGLFAHTAPGPAENVHDAAILFDHTFGYTNANTYNTTDPNIPDPLSPGVTVESTYNFYVDSAPNYEDVIAPANIPECILPNFYMLQTEILQYTSPTAPQRQDAYLEQVSAGTFNPDFTSIFIDTGNPPGPGPAGNPPDPATSEGYWNLYSTVLSSLNPDDMSAFEERYKNIVVPLGSLEFISEHNEASSYLGGPSPGPTGPFNALSAYPFYNKITLQPIGIPSYNDTNLGPERGAPTNIFNADFLASLLGSLTSLSAPETTCFVRSLQLLIANSYNPNASTAPPDELTGLVAQDMLSNFPRRPSLSMDLNFMGTGFNEESDQPQQIQHTLGKAQPIKICAEVDKILDDVTDLKDLTNYRSPYPFYYITLQKNTANAKDINYSILRDAIAGSDYSTAGTWEETSAPSSRGQIREAIKDYTRNLNSVFKGQLSNVSPLMYLIEKRRIPDGELSVPLSVEPVQRIFITRDFRSFEPAPITYYDTQIKYGVRYQYDVRVINIVFGTQYRYENVAADPDLWYTEQDIVPLASAGRALGNALGFYNEEEAQITTMGNYLVGGPVDGDGCQHNHLRLTNETDLATAGNSSLTRPTMYFSDSGELGWPSTPYQTDIGEDPGWDDANRTVALKAGGEGSSKPVGQTGYYVFGGSEQSLLESHPVESLRGRLAFSAWTYDFSTFYDNVSLGVFDLKSTINDPYGSQFDTPQPGGMYTPTAVNNILRRMEVKIVDGLGHDGNSTGGLIPWNVNVPVDSTLPGEIATGVEIPMCEWLKIYHGHIAEAFRDWYLHESAFCTIDLPQTPPFAALIPFGAGVYQWAMEGVYHDDPVPGGDWSCSTIPHHSSATQYIERWFHGDSNCALANAYPVPWNNGQLGDYTTLYSTYVTKFAGNLPDRTDEQGRNTAAWYCPNWTNSAAFTHFTIWRPHSMYQIVYWLLNGAAQVFANASDASQFVDPWYGNSGPRFTNLAPHNAFVYPKADLGQAHGRQILTEFMNYWNMNWQNYGPDPSRSHIGVYTSPLANTIEDAIDADHGNLWNQSEWMIMIASLYSEACMGIDAWPDPWDLGASNMTGQGGGY